MIRTNRPLPLIIAALGIFFAAGCDKIEVNPSERTDVPLKASFNLADYDFIIKAGPAVKMTTAGLWEDKDEIYIALDGTEDNVYRLVYDSGNGRFDIFDVAGASKAGFSSSGTVVGLHGTEISAGMKEGKLQGTVNGDAVWSADGTYSKNGKTITINMTVDSRGLSLIKITGLERECYVTNMKATYTSFTSLGSLTWDEGDKPSWIYRAEEGMSMCYGVPPENGILEVKYTTGNKEAFRRKTAIPTLGPGEMTTVKGPDEAPSEWEQFFDFDYYQTGEVITYQKSTKTNGINLVITGDGFTAPDLVRETGSFYRWCKYAADELLKVEPFKTYKSYFNVYFIAAVSNEQGADIGGNKKDTYFDTGWASGSSYSSMISSSGSSKLKSFIANYTPGYAASRTFAIVLCNEYTYAGLCHWMDTPVICFASVSLNTALTAPRSLAWGAGWSTGVGTTSGDFTNIVNHELGGHGVARLADEYRSYFDGSSRATTISLGQMAGYYRNLGVTGNGDLPWSSFKSAINSAGGYATGNQGLGEYSCKVGDYNSNVVRSDFIGAMCDNRKVWGVWNRYLISERIHSLAGESYSVQTFISEVPKQVTDPTWNVYRSPERNPIVDYSEITLVDMPAPPVGLTE